MNTNKLLEKDAKAEVQGVKVTYPNGQRPNAISQVLRHTLL